MGADQVAWPKASLSLQAEGLLFHEMLHGDLGTFNIPWYYDVPGDEPKRIHIWSDDTASVFDPSLKSLNACSAQVILFVLDGPPASASEKDSNGLDANHPHAH